MIDNNNITINNKNFIQHYQLNNNNNISKLINLNNINNINNNKGNIFKDMNNFN